MIKNLTVTGLGGDKEKLHTALRILGVEPWGHAATKFFCNDNEDLIKYYQEEDE